MSSDEELMESYVAGDGHAFELLFGRYGTLVLRYMRRGYLNGADAEDLTQQVFLQFHRARFDYEPGRPLRPWLMTIARNVKRDFLRRLQRRPLVIDLAPGRAPVEDMASRALESREAVRRAMAKLPPTLRIVVELHWQHRLRFAQIAQKLGISTSAAKVRAHRAYRALRKSLPEFGPKRQPGRDCGAPADVDRIENP